MVSVAGYLRLLVSLLLRRGHSIGLLLKGVLRGLRLQINNVNIKQI